MDAQQLILAILRGWWIIAAFTLISTGVGVAFSYTQQPMFETSSSFILNYNREIDNTYDKLYSIDTLAGRTAIVQTYGEIVRSDIVAEEARKELGIPPEMLAEYKRSCVALPDSMVLQLRVEGPSPYLATDLANTIAKHATLYVNTINEMYGLQQIDVAEVDEKAISPDHTKNATLSIIMGFAGGIAFSILRMTLMNFFAKKPDPTTTDPLAPAPDETPDEPHHPPEHTNGSSDTPIPREQPLSPALPAASASASVRSVSTVVPSASATLSTAIVQQPIIPVHNHDVKTHEET